MIDFSEVPAHYNSAEKDQFRMAARAAQLPDAHLSDRSRLGPTKRNGMTVEESLTEAFEAGFEFGWAQRDEHVSDQVS